MLARWSSWLISSAALVVLVTGCTDDTRTTAPAPPPGAFSPEQFSDIPLPRGYVFSPGQDQLAVTLAGGAVRRFEVTMEQRENAEPQTSASLLGEMERDLTTRGWTPAPMSSDKLEWQKDQERLVLETGRTGGRSTIRLRLRPAPLVGP